MFIYLKQWWYRRKRIKVLRAHRDLLAGFLSDYPADLETKRAVCAEWLEVCSELKRLENKP